MRRTLLIAGALALLAGGLAAAQCKATSGTVLDDGYTPAAPKRASVGTGFVLTGTVRGSYDCGPIAGATVEFWLAGPHGYSDNLRGTVVTDRNGHFRFQSPFPVSHGYAPHIHMNVAADAFLPIQTEFFPAAGSANGTFDVVLDPAD
ncbi:MAG TPA: intradiol ring-cleavage dioxygenase [bacterium]|nr:intradiol ring-cleavage dioxygenase [bacterium]